MRTRVIAEVKGVEPRVLARQVAETARLKPAEQALTDAEREVAEKALTTWGKTAGAPLKTWGDVFDAVAGDLDADGKADVDLEALAQATGTLQPMLAYALRSAAAPVYVEQTITAGDEHTIRMTGPLVTFDVRLLRGADGTFAPFTGDAPPGTTAIAEAKVLVANKPQLILKDKVYPLTVPLQIPGLAAADGAALLDRLLTVEAPEGSAFSKLQHRLEAQRTLVEGPMPLDPAEAVIWRAATLVDARVEAERAKLIDALGVRPLKYSGYLNEMAELPVAQLLLDAATPEVSASFLYAVAMGEGLNLWLDKASPAVPLLEQPVRGFQYLGVDTFGTRVDGLRRNGLIPDTFREGVDYTLSTHTNEKGERVTSADFPTVKAGITALTAMVADERRRFLADAERIGVAPTADQINFFTYLYFNTGSNGGRRLLEEHGLALAEKWEGPPPPNNRNAVFNSLQRVATWKMVEALGVFPA